MITSADIEAAAARIAPYVRRTPVTAAVLARDALPVAANVSLKLELHQVTGSFKARGAMNRYLGAPPSEVAAGIVTASGGNHGLAVARTAAVAGVPAVIFVPPRFRPPRSRR
ncbi:MAG: pyridoxal-phosphate dependent enzyme [Geminicoccaceae bacterium]